MYSSDQPLPDSDSYTWVKSRRSGTNDQCLEMAALPDAVALRDSKNPRGAVIVFTRGEWESFLGDVKGGVFG